MATVPVALTITRYEEIDTPEASDGLMYWGDYYAKVKIGNNPWQQSEVISGNPDFGTGWIVNGAYTIEPFWNLSATVDSSLSSIPIELEIWDEDDTSADEQCDINPAPGLRSITLVLDLATGSWTGGGLAANQPFSAGSGDSDRGRVFFEISTLSTDGDADGDGLLDSWERHGVPLGSTGQRWNLPGVAPLHKDLFVEVDAMTGRAPLAMNTAIQGVQALITPTASWGEYVIRSTGHGLATGTVIALQGMMGTNVPADNQPFVVRRLDADQFALAGVNAPGAINYAGGAAWRLPRVEAAGLGTGTTLDPVVDAFLAAPVPNPDGTTGIRLHVQIDETNIPFVANWANGFREFDAIKGNQTPNVAGGFGTRTERAGTNWAALRAAKAQVYRYAIFANTFGTTGAGGQSEYPGNDFMITLGTGNSTINQAACFMHELGHALGLHHGGDTGVNFKPNYRSIMNYALTYARTPIESSFVLDYSRQSLPTLNEGRLNESVGVGDASTLPGTNQPYQMVLGSIGGITGQLIDLSGSVDWSQSDANSDGVADNDPNVRADINRDGKIQVLTGYDDWSHLHYRLRDGSDFTDGSHISAEPENARLLQAYLSLEVRQTPGKITGLKWWDSNGDGRLASTEPRMEAWSIYLDLNRNGRLDASEPVTQSGARGEYQFNNVDPGVYDVREVMKPEWQQTFPGGLESHVVVVAPGQTTQGVNFGNARLGEIHGAKWHDVNANGVWDSNEPGMDGWVIYLDANRNGLRDPDERWTRTGNRGAYLFVGVPQGTWTVAEEMQSNWCQTYPGTPDVHVVALKAEQKLEGVNFGNARWASIEGNVWDDANADGRRDRGEQPLEGWQVFADANGNGTVDRGESSALSDPQGHYTLRVKPGTTTVRMLTQRGWKVSSPAHNSHTLALTSGLAVSGRDFGCVQERPVNEAALQKQFDFGTPRSPVEAGYSPVTERTKYATTLGYGWAAGKISSADRRSGNALDRDLTLTSKGTFVVDVPAGTYVVDLRTGDRGRYAHDLMGFSLEGIPVDPITTAAYQAEERSYLVHVVDGQLTIDLYDLGGSDRSVAIAGLTISTLPREAVPRTRPLTVTMNQAAGQFDPSPNSEAVFDVAFSEPVSGFTLADVLFSGLPAGSSASVTGRGTNYHVVVSGLTGQGTVTASVPAGVVTGLSGRANAASTSDDNSVRFLSPLVQFDFGTSRSSVEAGFRPVNERTAYATTLGYGWAAGRISSVARGTGSALDRDLNSTSQGTFVIDVCNGTYLVDVRFGDTGRVAHDWMAISVEGSQRDVVSTAATQMVWRRYEVVVTDGQLTLGLTDQGGTDKSVVIAGLMLTPASTPNVLADSLRAASPLVPWSSAVDAVLARGLE